MNFIRNPGFWILLFGAIILLISAVVFSQFMTISGNGVTGTKVINNSSPPMWTRIGIILGIILIIIGLVLLFFPPKFSGSSEIEMIDISNIETTDLNGNLSNNSNMFKYPGTIRGDFKSLRPY